MATVMNRLSACAALLPALILAGCANGNDYPSLARRPMEGSISGDPAICAAKVDIALPGDEALPGKEPGPGKDPGRIAGSAEPAPALNIPPPPQPPSRELTTRLGQLVDQARAAHGRFTAAQGQAERATGAASGATPGSEAWSVASVALSALESARSDALVALAELDQRYGDASVAAIDRDDPSEADAISAARDQVDALVREEDAVLTQLRSRLR